MELLLGKRTLAATIAAICGSALISPGYAIAQEDSASDDVGLEEIIVTATRRAQSVQDIPYNVSVLGGSYLEERGIGSIAEAMRAIPGAVFIDKGARTGGNNQNLILRGINSYAVNRHVGPSTLAPVVSIYVNETPIYVGLRLKDIERVEVLRGPQGTLYGSGSLGGTVRFLSNKPNTDEFTAEVTGGLSKPKNGDGVSYELDAVVNVPLGDKMALRVAGGYEDNAGWIDQPNVYALDADGQPVLDNGATDPVGDAANFFAGGPVLESHEGVNWSQISSVRASLRFEASDTFEATASFHYQDNENGAPPMVSEQVFGEGTFNSAFLALYPADLETIIGSFEAEYDMGFATLNASFSYYEQEGESHTDVTSFWGSRGFVPFVFGSTSNPRFLTTGVDSVRDQGTVFEARLQSKEGEKIDWGLGAFYFDQEYDVAHISTFPGYHDYFVSCLTSGAGGFGGPPCGFGTLLGVPGFDVVKDQVLILGQNQNYEDLAVFGELTYHISDKWQVTGGVRYFDQKFEGTTAGGMFTDPGSFPVPRSSSSKGDDVIFKANTSYDLNEDNMVYFTWSEGYRRGGSNALPLTACADACNDLLDSYTPDKTINREIGIKGTSADNRFAYTVTLFSMKWKDIQSGTLCTGIQLLCVVNIGDGRSQGVEVDLRGQLTENLNVGFAYTWQDSILKTEHPNVQLLRDGGFLVFDVILGRELPGVSKNNLYVDALYTQQLSNGMELSYGIDGSYRGAVEDNITVSDDSGLDRTDKFMLWNAHVGLHSGGDWDVKLFVSNIFNDTGIYARQPLALYPERRHVFRSTPRTFGLVASYAFGG